MTFDQANPCEVCTSRERSTTPLQALTLLNNPVFAECAQALGRRMANVAAPAPRQKLERGFELCLSRKPTKAELDRLERLFEEEERLAWNTPPEGPKPEEEVSAERQMAAEITILMAVAQVIMNLDEFLTRE